MTDDTGDRFQQATKYDRRTMPRRPLDWSSQPSVYKQYLNRRRIPLAEPADPGGLSLHESIRSRMSRRYFADRALSVESLSWLLWASTGISRCADGYEFRTAPSAGALYPIETYLTINNVEAIADGVYHYSVSDHHLELLAEGDSAVATARAALDQGMCAAAAVVFIWTAVFERSKWKYGQRAYRYVYLDAGHIAENLALAAAATGLGACHVAAIYDDEANALIGVDGKDESVIYMTAVGCV